MKYETQQQLNIKGLCGMKYVTGVSSRRAKRARPEASLPDVQLEIVSGSDASCEEERSTESKTCAMIVEKADRSCLW